jgi:hypothetical protein
MRRTIGLVVGCALLACASSANRSVDDDDGGSGDDGVVTAALSIAPALSELVIENGVAARQAFTATLTSSDGTTRDVTAETRFAIAAVYGGFDANRLAAVTAGRAEVTAMHGGAFATANVTVRVRSVRIDPALPATVASLFAGVDDPALAPQIVYPPLDSIMPRNLGDFEVHWTDRHANTVFEVSLTTELSDVRIYVPGGNGLTAQGPMASWAAFRPAEWLAAVGLESAVTYQLRGVNLAVPGVVGAAAPRTLRLSGQDMDGALYYWASATTASAIGVFRHNMAHPGQPAEEFLTTSKTGGTCIACHVLSRDGTRMAITYQRDGDLPGPSTMVDVASRAVASPTQVWSFGTFTPDNAQLLAVQAGRLFVRDAVTQVALATMPTTPANAKVTHPDLSPDGKHLVYVRPVGSNTDFDFQQGHIYVRSYDAATRTFGSERPLVSDGQNNFYPSWSPDGAWILFNRNPFGNAYDDRDTSAWVVKADGSQPPVELARANQTLGLTNSWARWAPFAQTLGGTIEPMYWVTMSSKRDFGVRLRNTGLAQRVRRAQLWMTPFFPARAAQRTDPSAPAFRLPFQNLESSNHLAQWTERALEID